jgi:hypothetical protein
LRWQGLPRGRKSLREIMKEKESNELRLTSGKSCDMRVIFLYRRLWLLKYLLRWVRVSTLEPLHICHIYDPVQHSLRSNRNLAKQGCICGARDVDRDSPILLCVAIRLH